MAYYQLLGDETFHRVPIGGIFSWRGQMWRRGRGIIYRARPAHSGSPAGILYHRKQRALRRPKKFCACGQTRLPAHTGIRLVNERLHGTIYCQGMP